LPHPLDGRFEEASGAGDDADTGFVIAGSFVIALGAGGVDLKVDSIKILGVL